MQRVGSCNRCGQCCGAEGSPNQDSPWPDSWPESLATWQEARLLEEIPLFQLLAHPAHGGPSAGVAIVGGVQCYWIWVPGEGLCADRPPYGNPSKFHQKCPFLGDDPGDSTRPCLLVGTPFQWLFDAMCEIAPPQELPPFKVAIWQDNHPGCSYTWTP